MSTQTIATSADEQAPGLIDTLAGAARHVALMAATVAMTGSLYFSEVFRWPPCLLCWYQRILMYPLVFILSIGILRRDNGLALYALPLSISGIGMSFYHYLVTKGVVPPTECVSNVPCTEGWLNILGFINVPMLALIAFTIITISMLLAQRAPFAPEDNDGRLHLDQHGIAALVCVGLIVGLGYGAALVGIGG